jgi:glycosyl hydrolase family 26
MRPVRPRSARPRQAGTGTWLIIGLLVAVNTAVIGGAVTARHWRLPGAAMRAASLRLPSYPARKAALAGHYTGVAVKEPMAASLATFAHVLGRPPGIVEYYLAFGNSFPAARAAALMRQGSLSLIQINPRNVSLAAIAAGRYDSYLRRYAAAVRAFGAPVALSFGHEMNGWWYTWGRPHTSPAAFTAAWRRMHAVFGAAHAGNAIWVWTISRDANRPSWPPAKVWWPGPAYVDWVGIDGYFRRPSQTYGYVFGRQLRLVRAFTRKPVLIGETAAAPGPHQAAQIASLVAGVRRDHLTGFVWFDINAKQHWNIDHDRAAAVALRTALARPGSRR